MKLETDLHPSQGERRTGVSSGALSARAEPPLTLRRNFSWTFVGNLGYALAQWGMLVVMAKRGTPQMVGQYALALALTAPVMLLANMKLRVVQATDARCEYQFADYLGLRLLATLAGLLVIAGLVGLGPWTTAARSVILAVGVAKSFESVSDVFIGLFQQHERMDHCAHSMLLRGVTAFVTVGGGLYLTGGILPGVAGMAVAWACILGGHDWPRAARLLRSAGRTGAHGCKGDPPLTAPRLWPSHLRPLIRVGAPLGVALCLDSLWTNVPRYFIAHYLGEAELGIFAAIASLMLVGATVIGALGQSASPRLARYHAEGEGDRFRSLLTKLLTAGALLGIGGVLLAVVAGGPFLAALYRPEYARHAAILTWLMLAAGLQYTYMFLGSGLSAMRHFTPQLPIHITSFLFTIALCAVLIPQHGLLGAAWAMLGGNIVEASAYTAAFLGACRMQQRAPRLEEASA